MSIPKKVSLEVGGQTWNSAADIPCTVHFTQDVLVSIMTQAFGDKRMHGSCLSLNAVFVTEVLLIIFLSIIDFFLLL